MAFVCRAICSVGSRGFCKITFVFWGEEIAEKTVGDLHDLSHYIMLTDVIVLRYPANISSSFRWGKAVSYFGNNAENCLIENVFCLKEGTVTSS